MALPEKKRVLPLIVSVLLKNNFSEYLYTCLYFLHIMKQAEEPFFVGFLPGVGKVYPNQP